jgi:hypothetical protein
MATESTEEHRKIQIVKNAIQRWVENSEVHWQGLHGEQPG